MRHPAFKVAIPARYAAARLPGKPLRELAGRPMLAHVHERALASGAEEVVIATDDARIGEAARAFGAVVCMTSADHTSGTERLAEVAARLGWADDAIVVNLQGDEPLMPPALLRQAAADLAAHPQACLSTLYTPIGTAAELFDPNVVKVVTNSEGYALYFSRAPIPWERDAFAVDRSTLPPAHRYLRHIGLYAYRAGFLKEYLRLPACALERAEALEQLRVLWHGMQIHLTEAEELPGPGVDTEADLARVEALLQARA
jgi:3-deoxy-manno-octulosonate cytidylyltransferase (CMP-KDO synthetase)